MRAGLLLLIGLLCINVYAEEEVYSIRQDATVFYNSTGFDIEIEDGKYADLSSGLFYDLSETLQLRLGLSDDTGGGIVANYTNISVDVTITPYNDINVAQTPLTQTLTVSYHGGGMVTDIKTNTFLHSGYHKYSIHVQPTTSFPSTVYFEALLTIDRYYHFDETNHSFNVGANAVDFTPTGEDSYPLNTTGSIITSTGAVGTVTGDEIEIWWDYMTGAEAYEVRVDLD